jgi:hypothetical protein
MNGSFDFDELALTKADLEGEIRDVNRRLREAEEANAAGDWHIAAILLNDYRPVGKYLESLRAQLAEVERRIAARNGQV